MLLKGLKGFSAWSVYNKVAFNLIFLRKHTIKSRDFAALLDLEDAEEIKNKIVELLDQGFKIDTPMADCILDFKSSSDIERKIMLVEALNYSDLTDDEVLRLLVLHKDKNGISYTKNNLGNLAVSELLPMMVDSLLACSHVDCDLSIVGNDRIDALKGKRIDVRADAADILSQNSEIDTEELLSLSVSKAMNNSGE